MNDLCENEPNGKQFDVVVIGGGQAALSMSFYLRRAGLDYVILDAQEKSGSAWLNYRKHFRLWTLTVTFC